MTEKSYYHVGSQRLYPPPPPPQDDNISGRSIGEQTNFDADSIRYSCDHDSSENYDMSQVNKNPLYRSDDDDIEKRNIIRSNEV